MPVGGSGGEGHPSESGCSDVAEDIAFLAMDLDFHGRPDLSQLFVDTYVEVSGDPGVHRFLDFFKVYRAYVRGKVASFRVDDPHLPQESCHEAVATAQSYFRLANSYASVLPEPALIVVAGLPGTGKSTVAAELARRWDVAHVSSDITRKELAGVGPTEHRYSPYGEGIYAAHFSRSTYDAMLDQAKQHIGIGRSVVLDATFRRGDERRRAVAIAEVCGAPVWIVELVLDEVVVKTRLEGRTLRGDSASDAWWETHQRQKNEWEPVSEVPANRWIQVDTSGPLVATIRQILFRMYASVLKEEGVA